MREIKYRGMTEDGKWIYGGYVKIKDYHAILSGEFTTTQNESDFNVLEFKAVKYKTVGQCTDRRDKNDKEIYENDILIDNVGRKWVIKYSNKNMCFMFHWGKDEKQTQSISHFNNMQKPFEVIGNINENPELLKEISNE